MTINVVSTTEPVKTEAPVSPEAKAEAHAEKEVESAAAASADEAETAEASEALESEEAEESESPEGEEETEKPKRKSGFKRRIEKLSKAKADALAEVEYWKKVAMESAAKPQAKPAQDAKPEAVAEGKPKADEFETHEEYVEALADWKVEQRLKAEEAKKRETEIKSEIEQKANSYKEAAKKFAATVDDFEEVLESADDVTLSIGLQQLLLESENGPELAYELARQRKEMERINKLPPLAMAREFGKFEASLKSSKAEETKPEIKTTKAPPPITPVGNKGAAPKKSIFDPSLSQAEYEALRAKGRSA